MKISDIEGTISSTTTHFEDVTQRSMPSIKPFAKPFDRCDRATRPIATTNMWPPPKEQATHSYLFLVTSDLFSNQIICLLITFLTCRFSSRPQLKTGADRGRLLRRSVARRRRSAARRQRSATRRSGRRSTRRASQASLRRLRDPPRSKRRSGCKEQSLRMFTCIPKLHLLKNIFIFASDY